MSATNSLEVPWEQLEDPVLLLGHSSMAMAQPPASFLGPVDSLWEWRLWLPEVVEGPQGLHLSWIPGSGQKSAGMVWKQVCRSNSPENLAQTWGPPEAQHSNKRPMQRLHAKYVKNKSANPDKPQYLFHALLRK